MARQAVVRSVNLTGWGKVPSLTPRHQVDLETGKNFRTVLRRTKPAIGKFSLQVGWAFVGSPLLFATLSALGVALCAAPQVGRDLPQARLEQFSLSTARKMLLPRSTGRRPIELFPDPIANRQV